METLAPCTSCPALLRVHQGTFLAVSWTQLESDFPPCLIHISITLGTSLIYSYLLSGRLPPQPEGLYLTHLRRTVRTLMQTWLMAHMSKSLLAGIYQAVITSLMGCVCSF